MFNNQVIVFALIRMRVSPCFSNPLGSLKCSIFSSYCTLMASVIFNDFGGFGNKIFKGNRLDFHKYEKMGNRRRDRGNKSVLILICDLMHKNLLYLFSYCQFQFSANSRFLPNVNFCTEYEMLSISKFITDLLDLNSLQ